ncbi:MAG: hypothetical protein JRN54_08050 [Nitrososphaerota archaeon]|nr:hypothetical protein [Nitrososphaerota archaeon]
MTTRRFKLVMVVIVASLVLMSAFVLLVEPGKTTPTRFSADFSDMQSYTLATNTSFEAKVASTDFSLLPVDLGQNLVSIGFYPKNGEQVTNLTVLDVYTGHVYFATSGSDIRFNISAGTTEIRAKLGSNVTILTKGTNLSGPHAQATFGFAAFAPSNFEAAFPRAFDVNLDPTAALSAGGYSLVNETLSIAEGNQTIAVGSTTTGTTIRISSTGAYEGQIDSSEQIYMNADDVSSFLYVPRAYTAANAGPPFASVLLVQYPFGRMNISTGVRTFLGVEKLALNGTISDLQVSNDSGRFSMTVDGSATYVMVDGQNIAQTSWSQLVEENHTSILSIASIVVAVVSLIVSMRTSRKSK